MKRPRSCAPLSLKAVIPPSLAIRSRSPAAIAQRRVPGRRMARGQADGRQRCSRRDRKGQEQGKSLGSGGGSAVKTLTAEAVAGLSADEFDAIYSTPEGKAMIDAL
jgi:hypothetical protein